MALVLGLVLILASSSGVWSQPTTWIDSNDLTQEIFQITRADSKYMEEMMELHTHNGVLDGLAYDNALKEFDPALHRRLTDFRKIHNELERENIDAMKFIDHVLNTARDARHGSIRQPQETKTIVDNFYGLSSTTRDYLVKKFPALKTVLGVRNGIGETPATMAPSVDTTTTAPTRTTTTAKTRSSNEERKLIRSARRKLNELIKSAILEIPVSTHEALSEAFKKVLASPIPWQLSDFEPIFENVDALSEKELGMCQTDELSEECTYFIFEMADIFGDVLRAAEKVDPKISALRQTFEETKNRERDAEEVLQLIQDTLHKLRAF